MDSQEMSMIASFTGPMTTPIKSVIAGEVSESNGEPLRLSTPSLWQGNDCIPSCLALAASYTGKIVILQEL
eukprot:scaffold313023_cov47-Prasinocladus_malaysianus.AAC.1